jgi:peptidyl-prolyl cis-trans isomerase C
MRVLVLLSLAVCALAQQTPNIDVSKLLAGKIAPPSDGPERVVAVVDGVKVTAGELFTFYSVLPSQAQFYYAQNRRQLAERYLLARRLAEQALANKLDRKSPYKEKLEDTRHEILMQARLDELNAMSVVTDDDVRKYYTQHSADFTQAKVSGILALAGAGAPQASRDKAATLVKRLRAGEDFAALAKAESADKNSAPKGGDIGWIDKDRQIPDSFRQVISALKPGEVSAPIDFSDGSWILRLDERKVEDLAAVKDQITQTLKQKALGDKLDAMVNKMVVKIEDESYFKKVELPTAFEVAAPPKP